MIGTIVIGIILAGIVALIVRKLYQDRKKGKSSCGCSCGSCPMSGKCHKNSCS